jgi:hypothetical protein
MTHPIGRGTVNVSANLLRQEREALGRIAVKADMSISHIIRRAITEMICAADAPTGRGLAALRRQRRQRLLNQAGQLNLDLDL